MNINILFWSLFFVLEVRPSIKRIREAPEKPELNTPVNPVYRPGSKRRMYPDSTPLNPTTKRRSRFKRAKKHNRRDVEDEQKVHRHGSKCYDKNGNLICKYAMKKNMQK